MTMPSVIAAPLLEVQDIGFQFWLFILVMCSGIGVPPMKVATDIRAWMIVLTRFCESDPKSILICP